MPGLDASHQGIPMQRVMESLGSDTNRENFAILWGSINLNKAQVRHISHFLGAQGAFGNFFTHSEKTDMAESPTKIRPNMDGLR